MTKVEMIYTREREEAVKEAKKEAKKEKKESAVALIKEGVSVEKVAKCLKMPEAKVKKLAESITVTVSE